MVSGVIGMTVILMALSGMRGTFDAWQTQHMLPKGLYGVELVAFDKLILKFSYGFFYI